MATGTQVLHIEKRVSIAAGLNRHITRQQFVTVGDTRTVQVWVPDNADPSRTDGNVELVSREFVNSKGQKCELTLQQAVDKRIREASIKPRKGQATCLEIIFSGSHDVLAAMSKKELRKWADDTLKWAQKTWGKENVVSASLHVDERTPHIHMIVVPIVTGQSRRTRNHKLNAELEGKKTRTYKINHDKLRLCVNEVYTTGKLYQYHDNYAKEVSLKYGLDRGVRAEPGSKKKHSNSEDYNRWLAVQAAEQQALIQELTADYAEKKAEIQEIQGDIQQLQSNRETLSAAVEGEEKKLATTQTKTKEAEERLSSLEEKITKNRGIINNQVADFNTRKEELSQTKADIAANKSTIAQQKQTISENEATIQKQEKRKSSTIINDDAADRAILEKYKTVSDLADEETRLQRSIRDKKTELATVDANVRNRRKQLAAQVELDTIPKKGLMGYRTEDVDKFVNSVNKARLRLAMNNAPDDIKVDGELQEEINRLRTVEDDYKDFMNSPERLQQRIVHLETEAKRKSIAEILRYALQKVVDVIRFTVDNTPKGEDIFAKFTIKGDSIQYAGRITPDEYISYTSRSYNSLQELKEHWQEKIWYVVGSLSEIQAKREKEDTLSRYSTKLSTLLQEKVDVTDYVREEKHYLLFASNGRVYDVNPDGSTWSTADRRIKTLADCRKYSQEKIWKNHGDINNPPKISRGIHR